MSMNQPNSNTHRGPRGRMGHRQFAQSFGPGPQFARSQGPQMSRGRRPKYNVPLNVSETDTTFEVHVYALGFQKEHIKISVADDLLHITGTRTIDEDNIPVFSRQEFPVRSFERVLGLSEAVDQTAITARQVEGVLIVTLPKTTQAQATVQEIEVA